MADELRDTILALLEDGEHAVGELAEWLDCPVVVVVQTLIAMAQDGLVVKHGALKGERWGLNPDPAPPAPRPCALTVKPRKALRQARPSAEIPANGAPAWWVGVSREEFAERQRQQQDKMNADPINKSIKPMILGGAGPGVSKQWR